jgi:hypothetical protein
MIRRSAWITLRQHRFEVGAAVLFAIVLGFAALQVTSQLVGTGASTECMDRWKSNDGNLSETDACVAALRRFSTISEDSGGKVLALMAILPFAAGLLGGVTLVGRELETRTAQTAWALSPSRRRWFGRQLWPVLVVVGAALAFAALAATTLVETRLPWTGSAFQDMQLHGPIVVARALGTLGVGLLVGAVLGRTLPAFLIAIVLSVGLVLAMFFLREGWLNAQPLEIGPTNGGYGVMAWIVDGGYVGPDGTFTSWNESPPIEPPADVVDYDAWLADQGYRQVSLGVTTARAMGWLPLEIAAWTAGGLVLILATVLVIDRRRPG